MEKTLLDQIDSRLLEGKRALILSAAHPAALKVCSYMVKAGCEVAMLDTGTFGFKGNVSEKIVREHGCYFFEQGVDVSSADLESRLVSEFGEVDIIVAYPCLYEDMDLMDVTCEDWFEEVEKPLRDIFFASRKFSQHMVKKGEGRIIFISAVQAKTGGWLSGGGVAFCTVMSALCGLARGLAVALAPCGVTVNTVLPLEHAADPNTLLDNVLPIQRMPDATDVAGAVLFLASEGASFITGYSLDINCGLMMD